MMRDRTLIGIAAGALVVGLVIATVAVAVRMPDRGGTSTARLGPAAGSPGPSSALDGQSDGTSSEPALRLEEALWARFGDPLTGSACLTVEEARIIVGEVLTELGMSDWGVAQDAFVRDEGCAVASPHVAGHEVLITSTWRPEIAEVLEAFRDRSLAECFDAQTATRLLTEALEAAGHVDFEVQQRPYVAGPDARWDEITAHAEEGCIFYTLSAPQEGGRLLHYLNGG